MDILSKTNPIRQLAAMILLAMLSFPVSAQQVADSLFTFRFYPAGSDKFFSPGLGNGEELARMYECVDRYKGRILAGEIVLHVNGYCNSKGSAAGNLAVARTRSNRVKSELITRKGLTEDCFLTRNHSGEGDFVTVCGIVNGQDNSRPAQPEPVDAPAQDDKAVEAEAAAQEEPQANLTDEVVSDEVVMESEPEPEAPVSGVHRFLASLKKHDRLVFKTNLLYYAALMPNIEAEWMFKDRWSAALEVQGAWYAKDTPHKVYRLATVIPEARYWVIDRSRWHGMYVGVFVGGGLYDLSNGKKKGHKGEGAMGGVSAGYMWPIGSHLSLDASLGVGYLYARDKEYVPADGHFLYQLSKNVNYFGPLRLKLSLVWRFKSNKSNR